MGLKFRKLGVIERRTIMTVVLAVTSVFLVWGAFDITHHASALRATKIESKQLVVTISSNALSLPLWNYDEAQTQDVLDALIADPDFVAARLFDDKGNLFIEIPASEGDGSGVFSLSGEVFGGPRANLQSLGFLHVDFSTKRIDQKVAAFVRQRVIGLFTILIAVATATLVAVGRVTVPLARVAKAISQFQDGDLQGRTPETERKDEIGDVARTVEDFRLNALEIEDLRNINDRLAGIERRRIYSALVSAQDAALISDEAGRLVFTNPQAEGLLGVIGTSALFNESDGAGGVTNSPLKNAMRARTQYEGVIQLDDELTTGIDTQVTLKVRTSPINDEAGEFLGSVILCTDISEEKEREAQIQYLADHDGLTGLKNRRVLDDDLHTELDTADPAIALILLDLDRFKIINDTLGHQVGDELLIAVSKTLVEEAEDTSTVYRLGGDEFAIIARNERPADYAKDLSERIISALARPFEILDREIRTNTSIGILTIDGASTTPGDALKRVDLALYQAKRQGRGQYVVFEETMEHAIRRKTTIETDLSTAIAEGQTYAMFQRQIDFKTGEITGFEALARWEHPTLGFISPGEFIPIAEETAQIEALTHSILREACRAAAGLQSKGYQTRMAVNISPLLFRLNLSELVQDVLMETGCHPSMLELEITEAVSLNNTDHNIAIITELRDMGICFALDDFGVGYSSLSYLQQLPVDRIKIDKNFIDALSKGSTSDDIIQAIVTLTQALGMETVAEGVETLEQARALQRIGVTTAQGYFYGKPERFDMVEDALRAPPKAV